jgi:ankyrin repeat protein
MRPFPKGVALVLMVAVMSLSHATAMEDPLHDPIKAGDLALVKAIISKGADINKKNAADKTPLDLAREMGHDWMVRILEDAIAPTR